jgi:ribose transport system substrate-binding protein
MLFATTRDLSAEIYMTARISAWALCLALLAALGGGAYWIGSRRLPAVPTIAFVPQTAGAMLWEVEHLGARTAAERLKLHLYWNAPTSENDMAGQVMLIDRVIRGNYQGLVLAPNHSRAILAPLRRALAAGLPVVVVSSSLDFPASDKLGYIVNDDEMMGEIAAAEIARLIQGKGSIAIVGLTRYAPGVIERARGAERLLAGRFPEIRVVSRGGGAYNSARVEEITNGLVDEYPELKAILSFTAVSTRGVYAALKSRSLQKDIHIVGCEQDSDLMGYLGAGEIAAIAAENTYRMGHDAVELISASWAGKPIPARSVTPPLLITRRNFNSAEASLYINFPR